MLLNKRFDRVKRYLGIPDSPTSLQIRESKTRQQVIVPPAFLRRNRLKSPAPSATLQPNGLSPVQPRRIQPLCFQSCQQFASSCYKLPRNSWAIFWYGTSISALSSSPYRLPNGIIICQQWTCADGLSLGIFWEATKFLALVTWTAFTLHWVWVSLLFAFASFKVSEARQMKSNELRELWGPWRVKLLKKKRS